MSDATSQAYSDLAEDQADKKMRAFNAKLWPIFKKAAILEAEIEEDDAKIRVKRDELRALKEHIINFMK